ncbi:MAG: TipAS antibiotic-recognition domain-containing protein [Candidatus Saccharicenans sp.]|nr:TipAS antibiotic-recognition domain-containing protein [Candidatus Saccharicenans sp.]MDI6850040.1 TipAS antibiotic-recognition domain-containing protein [Candidatus Saccharicenans sp.]
MSKRRKTDWPENFYSPQELTEFAETGAKFTPAEMQAYQKKWVALIDEIKSNLNLPPDSPEARRLTARWQELLEEGFAGHEKLLARIGQAYNEGAIPGEYSMMDHEALAFINKVQEGLARK